MRRFSILKNKVDKAKFKRVLIIGAGYAGISLLKDIDSMYEIDVIILVIPSLDKVSRSRLLKTCSETSCETKIILGVWELLEEKSYISRVRAIALEDVLGRGFVLKNRFCGGIG